MNERIIDLATQANFELVECWGKADRDSLEKFYELIVQHAVECVRDVMRDEQSSLTYVAGADGRMIMWHAQKYTKMFCSIGAI